MTQSPLIETKELTIRFGGHVAVDHVNLQILSYTFKSIIGPNGAGKTTFFNMISGQYSPTEGRFFSKVKISLPSPQPSAQNLGSEDLSN